MKKSRVRVFLLHRRLLAVLCTLAVAAGIFYVTLYPASQAAAEGLRRFRRLARRLRVIQYLNLVGFCLQHIYLLPQASLRGRRLRNLSKYWCGAYHTVNVKKLQ